MSLDLFSAEIFQQVLDILKLADYEFPPFPPINSNLLEDFITPKLAAVFRKMPPA